MGVLWGKIGEGVVRYWPLTNSFFLLGVLTSVPILVKIDQEMRPWECSQTDKQTDRLTDANRFYNLSHAICYSYGTDNNSRLVMENIKVKKNTGQSVWKDKLVILYFPIVAQRRTNEQYRLIVVYIVSKTLENCSSDISLELYDFIFGSGKGGAGVRNTCKKQQSARSYIGLTVKRIARQSQGHRSKNGLKSLFLLYETSIGNKSAVL